VFPPREATGPRGRERLVIAIGSLLSDGIGGAQQQAEGLAARMSEDFDVVVLSRANRLPAGIEDRGTYRVIRRPLVPLKGVRGLVDIVLMIWQMGRFVDGSTTILGMRTLYSGFAAAVAGRLFGATSIVSIRGEVEYQRDLARLPQRIVSRMAWNLADRVLLQSPGLVQAFTLVARKLGVTELTLCGRTGLLPNGIDLPPEVELGEGFVFTGRLHPIKGLNVLLEALELLPESERPRVTIVGDGPLRRELSERAIGLPVTFVGAKSREEVLRIVGQSRGLLFPAVGGDGMPNSVMEAMALGRPVVATQVGALPEMIEDGVTGLLVDVGSPVALAAAIRRLHTDREYALRLGLAARAFMSQFSWAQVRLSLGGQLTEARQHKATRSRGT
jgi:glycosyltransferase involved in cell wall biosynthesis